MRVTRVVFEQEDNSKALATCSVVLDDCLKLTSIKLFRNQEKGFYLVLPSKQDMYQEIDSLNSSLMVQYPQSSVSKGKVYEEFFYPLKSSFYKDILDAVVEGYRGYKSKGTLSYRP